MPDFQTIRGLDLELLVDGRAFSGWEDMTIGRSLDALSASLSLTVSDRSPFPIRPGQACEVRVGAETVLTGYVDLLDYQGSPEGGRTLTIQARDRTSDLVDCSDLTEPGEWVNVSLLELAQEIALPFDVEVRALYDESQVARFDLWRRQPGETAWASIERALRRRGLLGFSDGEGVLLIDRPASNAAAVALVEDELGRGNVERWRISVDYRSRFSRYLVLGQSFGVDGFSGQVAAEIAGEAFDEKVARARPLLILGDSAMLPDDAEDRAAWEASIRAARSERLEVDLASWEQVPGRLWKVNETVAVRIPSADLDTTLLVDQVVLTRTADRTQASLGLTRPDAYRAEPIVEAFDDFLGSDS